MCASVSELRPAPAGIGGMTCLGCSLCGAGISGIGGPGCRVICERCWTAIADADPLGEAKRIYQYAIHAAIKTYAQQCLAEGRELPEWLT